MNLKGDSRLLEGDCGDHLPLCPYLQMLVIHVMKAVERSNVNEFSVSPQVNVSLVTARTALTVTASFSVPRRSN